MECSKCGKILIYKDKNGEEYTFSAFRLQIQHTAEDGEPTGEDALRHNTGKYYQEGDSQFNFCYECILDILLK